MKSRNASRQTTMQIEDRAAWGQAWIALSHVICGSSPQEQKLGVAVMVDVLKSDYVSARRMLSIMDATPSIERDFPELREICANTVRGPLSAPYRGRRAATSKPRVKLKASG